MDYAIHDDRFTGWRIDREDGYVMGDGPMCGVCLYVDAKIKFGGGWDYHWRVTTGDKANRQDVAGVATTREEARRDALAAAYVLLAAQPAPVSP